LSTKAAAKWHTYTLLDVKLHKTKVKKGKRVVLVSTYFIFM